MILDLVVGACLLATAQVHPPGNVLFVLADDMGVDRVAAYGEHPDPPRTPVLDSLAEHGVLFRNAWVNPVCSPTRVTILTGRYGFRTGIGYVIPSTFNALPGVAAAEVTLAEALRRQGYFTAAIGKWHMNTWSTGGYQHPILAGFHLHVGSMGNIENYFSWSKNTANKVGNHQNLVPRYATSESVDDALAVIDRVGDAPWFLWLAFNAPHQPFHVPPEHLLSPQTKAELAAGTPSDGALHKAMVEALDSEIGRLLAGIDPTVLQRTTVIFLGDNGTPEEAILPPTPNKGAKGTVLEGGVNVPLLVAGAGVVAPGREVEALVNGTDVYSTILELLGAVVPDEAVDSVSFLPSLRDPQASAPRSWVYTELFNPNGPGPYAVHRRAIRGPRYKLIQVQVPVFATSLFDLWADPLEETSLLNPSHPPLTWEQQEALDSLLAQLDELE